MFNPFIINKNIYKIKFNYLILKLKNNFVLKEIMFIIKRIYDVTVSLCEV